MLVKPRRKRMLDVQGVGGRVARGIEFTKGWELTLKRIHCKILEMEGMLRNECDLSDLLSHTENE